MLSLINIVDGRGEAYNQGELLRWLGESVLYPTNFLPSQHLKWAPISDNKAKLIFEYNGLSLFFIVTVNAKGEITQMETKRHMEVNKLETWIIQLSKYKEMNCVMVPTALKVLWRLPKGDFTYADFSIQKLEYDIPEKF